MSVAGDKRDEINPESIGSLKYEGSSLWVFLKLDMGHFVTPFKADD